MRPCDRCDRPFHRLLKKVNIVYFTLFYIFVLLYEINGRMAAMAASKIFMVSWCQGVIGFHRFIKKGYMAKIHFFTFLYFSWELMTP